MATKRPAKLAIGKKATQTVPNDENGKAMTACKVYRKSGSNGMHWVTIEDFDGSDQAAAKMRPIR